MIIWLRYALGAVVLAAAAGFWWWQGNGVDIASLPTGTVERGTVTQAVSVSGFIEADNTVELSFPAAGRISEVYVKEGDVVSAGTLLATIGQERLAAERSAALANVRKAEANQEELVNGQTTEERAVTETTVAKARAAWEQTTATELQKVQNALIALRSNGLAAYAADTQERATPPTISGAYICDTEGEYQIEVYRSGAVSGYSARLTGLETGTIPVTFDQPAPFGSCGLEIQFVSSELYANSEWLIPIPNTRSATYLTYRNAYDLATQQAEQNIQAAKQALDLAEDSATEETAAPRVEALLASNATVRAAQAELNRIDAQLADQSITAPFAGIVTEVDKLKGEIATTEPMITLLAEDAFTLIARIPEIDITKVSIGQTVTAIFDAKSDEPQQGTITFINPIATEIDGVAYFETKISLNEKPDWIRAGLNADIDVEIEQRSDVLVLPRRFVERTPEGNFVTLLENETLRRIPVETGLIGTNGLVEIIDLASGTVVVATQEQP